MIKDGLLNINKPCGVTSFWVVRQIKKILGVKKVGHCGTLDPLAKGVLLILFGKATKMQNFFFEHKKQYRARFLLGITTDSGDITGKILKKEIVPLFSDSQINHVLEKFTGEIEQIPPMYSALKHKGKKLYEFARQGIEIERLPRRITIYNINLIAYRESIIELTVECSRGTYIRTLAEDIGKELGCGATVEFLCREKVGPFNISTAIDGSQIDKITRTELFNKAYSMQQLDI